MVPSDLGIAPFPSETTGGSYFVSNYPPFNFWKPDQRTEALAAFDTPPEPDTPLGIYLHIPFCRRRCHFCYFRVYTDKNASEITDYLNGVGAEFDLLRKREFVGGRKPKFIYFGGGTPSYLSPSQLRALTDDLHKGIPWDDVEEVTFEAEPGTLTESKLRMIREIGVTRLSLGIENFDDDILDLNGRAHRSKEVYRAYDYARSIDFPQINIDLIAGMINETDENWQRNIERALELEPDCLTIYQMEVPFNTTIYREMRERGDITAPIAEWNQKRRWVDEAFSAFEAAGYSVSSAYTVVKDPASTRFVYRDSLWTGADLLGLGVSSFGHVNSTHMQNEKDIGPYLQALAEGRLPVYRAMRPSQEEKMIRQLVLQFKLGHITKSYFQKNFNVDVGDRFAPQLEELQSRGLLSIDGDVIKLSRDGLLKVDWLVHAFFLPEHRPDQKK
jgi:oxygen-independent coproporphyrinogen-3 oxidase